MLEKLGIHGIINASGTLTILGGNRLVPEALEAIIEVSDKFIDMEELSINAGRYVAKLVNASDAFITSGAAAGIVIAIGAIMTEGDPSKMSRLPFTEGMKNKIIVQYPHTINNPYLHLVDIPGARIKIVGGQSGVKKEDIQEAIDDDVAGILHFFYEPQNNELPLEEVLAIAHEHKIPLILDAAAELPPATNLKKFIGLGCDVVIFSGGKDIGAPNDTGVILANDKNFIDNCRKIGPWSYLKVDSIERVFIGRALKMSKEDVVAFVAAFEKYLKTDHEARLARMNSIADLIITSLQSNFPNLDVEKIIFNPGERIRPANIPKVAIHLPGGMALKCMEDLKSENPAIYTYVKEDRLYLNTHCLRDSEVDTVISRLLYILRLRLNDTR